MHCIVDFNKYLLKACVVQICCFGCDKMVLLGILATMSGLANDRKHTFVNALFTQLSDLCFSLFLELGKRLLPKQANPVGKVY